LEHIYNGSDRDIDINKIIYKWESERLEGILADFDNLYTKYRSLLLLWPTIDPIPNYKVVQKLQGCAYNNMFRGGSRA